MPKTKQQAAQDKIIKTSEDGVIEGISFKITGNNTDKTVTTGKDGTISTQLLPGSYTVTELPSDKYVSQPPQNVTVTSGKTSTVTFSNVLKKFRVKATKIDSETNTSQGDATLSGALYGLFDGNKQVATFTTDADSSFETPYYVCGDNWTIKELSPSTGYLLNDAVYSVGAEAKDYELELNTAEMTLKETVVKGNIRLIKHVDEPDPDVSETENGNGETAGMAERPEAGATFEIYLKSAGSYDKAKDIDNKILRGNIDGIKYGEDSAGGESKALDGALIGLFKGDAEEFTEENAIMTYTTGANGKFTFEKIPYGHFVVAEIQAPDGYTISMERHHVYINADGQTIPIRLDDTLIRGSVQVMKTEAVDEPSEAATPDEAALQNKDSKDKGLVCELPPVDSGYRGEIHAILSNVGNATQTVHKDARIGQLIITPVVIADYVIDRGEQRGVGAFGSTGE